MTPRHGLASPVHHLTDVQLVHRLNDAIRERERTVGSEPHSRVGQWLRQRQWQNRPLWSFLVIVLQVRDAATGAWLAVSFAPSQRIEQWLACSEVKWQGLREDIAILRLLGETARRVHERDPGSQRQEALASR